MKFKWVILALICGLFVFPLAVGAEPISADSEMILLASGGGSTAQSMEDAGLTFTDICMIVLIILVTIYFTALYVKEWRQVR